ncbi:MAG: NUDIX hydrolase [Patescibacteria group bacterium]
MPLLQTKKKEIIFKGKFIDLWGTEFMDKNGNSQIWEWIARKSAALVFPITANREVVLVKNFRVPLEKYVIETPAGLIDKPGESPLDVVKRELLEETGYQGHNFIAVPPWPYRSGSSNGMIYAFIATDAVKILDNVTGDATEDITVVTVPLIELVDVYFNPPPGVLFQAEILAIYMMAQRLGIVE